MLKQNWRLVARFEQIGDFLLILICFFAAYYGRDSLVYWNDILGWKLPFSGDELAPIKDYFLVLLVGAFSYLIALQALGAYGSMRLVGTWSLLRISFLSSVLVFVCLATVLFVLKIDLSRSFIGIFCIFVGLTLWLERYLILRVLRFWRRRGKNFRNVFICGLGTQAARLAELIEQRPELGIKIRGFVDLREMPGGIDKEDKFKDKAGDFRKSLESLGLKVPRIINGQEDCERALQESAVDEVIFTDVIEVMPSVEEIALACAEQGIRTTLVADLFSIGLVNSGMSYFGELPLIHFQTPPGDSWKLALKRWIDFFISAFVMIVFSPLFIFIALAVLVFSGRPVFFVQRRVGLNGRLFYLYKFRSMEVDAHKKLEELRDLNEMEGPVFKISKDPRITPIGRFLRRFSLDELPQFFNVLIGDMSLVGPRPPVPGEVSLYERKNRRRLSMRPGLTCTWQVSGRNNIKDFESWVSLDLEYIDNWSLLRDFVLMIRTIPAVILGAGAR